MLTLDCIKKAVIPIAEKYDIKKIDVFRSLADGTATKNSDADFLVNFSRKRAFYI